MIAATVFIARATVMRQYATEARRAAAANGHI
jgi:hypothetical protein